MKLTMNDTENICNGSNEKVNKKWLLLKTQLLQKNKKKKNNNNKKKKKKIGYKTQVLQKSYGYIDSIITCETIVL